MSRQTLAPDVERSEAVLAVPARVRSWPFSKRGVQAAALLLAPTFLLIFFVHFFTRTDPDYWWHVRTGQYVYETGLLPKEDIFSYTAAGWPWVTHEWLTELLLYIVYRQFGYVGNVALFGLISVLTWLAVYVTCRLRGIGELGATVLAVWGFGMAMPLVNVRPQMLTALLLAITALLLTRFKHGDAKAIWPLPPLFALWVNLHGGYVIGLALLGMMVVGEGLTRWLRRPAWPLRPLITVSLSSVGATLLNPNGIEALLYPFTYAGTGNASMRYIAEWQSPNFHMPSFLVFGASILLAVVLGLHRRPLGVTEVLWTLALALMALQSGRHIPLYAVAVTPLLAERLQTEIPSLRNTLERWRRPALLAIVWVGIVASMALVLRSAETRSALQFGWEPNPNSYPVGAVEYLGTHDVAGNLFNQYDWGGYLIYQLFPQRRVFIDGRADVYGDGFVESYADVWRLRPNWRQVLDEHDVRLVLVSKDSQLAVVLGEDKGWQEVYAGEVERLFVRRESSGEAYGGS